MSAPVADDAGLRSIVTEKLVLQCRVPEAYSASPNEHEWHDAIKYLAAPTVTVTDARPSEMLTAAAELLGRAPERRDVIYRVILQRTQLHEMLVRP